jgi:hypothetical protein
MSYSNWPPRSRCTHTQEFPVEAANEALQRLKHDQINGAAALRIS